MAKEKKLTKKEEEVVQKKLRHVLYERAKRRSSDFGNELKKHSVVAITAAFGFLIALAWKEPVVGFVGLITERFGMSEGIASGFVSAIAVTIIAVLGLMAISKWSAEKRD